MRLYFSVKRLAFKLCFMASAFFSGLGLAALKHPRLHKVPIGWIRRKAVSGVRELGPSPYLLSHVDQTLRIEIPGCLRQ